MRERALGRHDNPNSPSKTSAEVFFVSSDFRPRRAARTPIMTTAINTDLLTPLGAYLRLRDAGRASFILESVERGRLGRNSWMGAGSRIVEFDEAAELGLPIVGYLAYDHVAQPRADGAAARWTAAASRRAGSSSARRSFASTTARASPRSWPAIRGDRGSPRGRTSPGAASHEGPRGRSVARPTAPATSRWSRT